MIPPPIKYPLELACPKCRLVFFFVDEKSLPWNELAMCMACDEPLMTREAANAQIFAQQRSRMVH